MKKTAALATFAVCIIGAAGSAHADDRYLGSYYGDRSYYDDYDRERSLDRERDRLDVERERLESERGRFDAERAESLSRSKRSTESCPAGYSPSEQKCSPKERKHGCKDMRLPGGLGCVHR